VLLITTVHADVPHDRREPFEPVTEASVVCMYAKVIFEISMTIRSLPDSSACPHGRKHVVQTLLLQYHAFV
jgi:hypothetical protein